jgi:NAD(P)-dependent dehydrogenase (short-subunit alcohol dehydrogenase family)
MATILVTGATGNVGREVTTQLVSAGFPVRAFVRDARTARFPEGVEAAAGDPSAPETLGRALTGIEAVFLVWPFLTSDGAPTLFLVSPPGHELYLDEIGEAISGGGAPDPAVIAEIRSRHDIQQLTSMKIGRLR